MGITRWFLKNKWKDIILSFFDAIREISKKNKEEPESNPYTLPTNPDKGSSTKPRDTSGLRKRTDPTKVMRGYK